MKLYAHRGWSMGADENTLAAFARASQSPHVDGVEFDIRRGRCGGLVVIHDPPQPEDSPPSLDSVLDLLKPTSLGLLLEIKEPGLGEETVAAIRTRNLQDRAIVFGFPKAAASLPWDEPRAVRLGLIAHLPWQANGLIARYRPDVFMLGWDRRVWTRTAFRVWWTIFKLHRFGKRHTLPIVAGIAQRKRDYDWLKREGATITVADLDIHGKEGFAESN